MFTNPGRKLKIFSKILFWLSLLGTIILAFTFGNVEEIKGTYYLRTETVFHPEIFFTILIVGLVFSYLEGLCLYGFGELIENSKKEKPAITASEMLQDIETNLPTM